MRQSILHVSLVVRDYDEAIAFYTEKLNFTLLEDTYQPEQDKRWVVIAPPGSSGASIVLGRATNAVQEKHIGNQTGGRVFLFLQTDDFWRDYNEMQSRGIRFIRKPKTMSYGTVAVFEDLYGNLWDLIQPATSNKFVGVWELQPDQCTYELGQPPVSGTYEIRQAGDSLTFIMHWIDAAGKHNNMAFTEVCDAAFHPYPGSDIADELCLSLKSATMLESTARKNGVEVLHATRELLSDTELRVTISGPLSEVGKYRNVSLYKKLSEEKF